MLGRRWIFWPAIPRPDHDGVTRHLDEIGTPSPTTTPEGAGAPSDARRAGLDWPVSSVAAPRATWVTTAVILLACAAFAPTFTAKGIQQSGSSSSMSPRSAVSACSRSTSTRAPAPLTVIVPEGKSAQALALLDRTDGLTGAAGTGVAGPPAGVPGAPTVQPKVVDGRVMLQATLDSQPDSPEAERLVRGPARRPRHRHRSGPRRWPRRRGDRRHTTSNRDLLLIAPTITVLVFLVLMLLLRRRRPLLLLVANLLSFGATLGVSAIAFNHVFRFGGADPRRSSSASSSSSLSASTTRSS